MSRIPVLCCLCLAAAAGASAGERAPAPAAPSGVRVVAQPSAPSLPLERKGVDRRRVVEQRLADGTVLAHLDGEGRERSGVVIGPDGARAVCGSALEAVVDFRGHRDNTGDARR